MIFRINLRWLVMWMLAAASAPAAGPFAAPADGPVAFRRDRLPLEVERMRELSRGLESLARGQSAETPAQRQAVARMLALALALDPGNTAARSLMEEFEKGSHFPEPAPAAGSREDIWKTLAWLRSTDAGGGGLALADCLVDVLAVSAPADPRVAEWKSAGDRGAWTGWVPALSSYEERARNTPIAENSAKMPKPLLESASLIVPLWSRDAVTRKWALAPVPVKLSVEAGESFLLTIRPGPGDQAAVAAMAGSLTQFLRKNAGVLPAAEVRILTDVSGEYSYLKNKRDLSAAAAVLAGAAATGRKPAGAVIGVLDAEGALGLPPDFWEKLRAIDRSPPGRLVLPAAAAEYLTAYLALGDPGFFLRHEILLASDFKELSERLAESPAPPLDESTARFSEIVSKQAGQPIGQYLTNRFVRQRLAEISQATPWHHSARMLAIQGSGDRPRHLPEKVLASEIRSALVPMSWVTTVTPQMSGAELAPKLDDTYAICDAALERLKPYVDPAAAAPFENAVGMVGKIRTLSRATRIRNKDLYTGNTEFTPALAALLAAYREVKSEFSIASEGTSADPEIPEP